MNERKKNKVRKRTFLFISITALIVFSCGFLGAEIFFRLNYKRLDLDTLTGREAGENPYRDWAFVDAFSAYRAKPGAYMTGGEKTVNSHGFISTPEITPLKQPGEIRIAFFGGSSTAGTGFELKDTETWPWKVAQMFMSRYPGRKITFINAALGGYSTFESYGRFWSRVRFFKPDVIVVNHGWNELYYFTKDKVEKIHEWRTLADGSWSLDGLYKTQLIEPKWYDGMIKYSQLLTRLRVSLSFKGEGELAVIRDESGASREYDPRALGIFRDNLRLFASSAKAMNIELFVCKQPTTIYAGKPDSAAQQYLINLHSFDYESHIEAFEGIYKVVEGEVLADRIIDLTPISTRRELMFDFIHPNDAGTTQIALIVSTALSRYLDSIVK